MAITNDQIYAKLRSIEASLAALLNYNAGQIQQLNSLGEHMSELDQSVEALQASVIDLADRIDEPRQELADALARNIELNAQIAELSADDAADQAEIDALTAERDAGLADAQQNVGKIQSITGQIQSLATTSNP